MLTVFEQKVLNFVKQIPRGKVTSYQCLAKKLGNIKFARAVGNALSKNPKLITVPCHRVIKKDGQIGNYALGLAKKAELLQNEGIKLERGKIEIGRAHV